MKRFLEMIEIVKRQGGVPIMEDKDPLQRFDNNLQIPEKFYEFAEQSVPFVFTSLRQYPQEIEGSRDEDRDDLDLDVPDAPFKIFSIEMLGSDENLTVPYPGTTGTRVIIEAILVVEMSPKEYTFVGLFQAEQPDGTIHRIVGLSWTLAPIVNTMLKRLGKETVGIEQIRERVKIGSGKSKRVATFRKIVHVRPKRGQTPRSDAGREIEWTHRWQVMGHWRKVEALGKDREGNYSVEGWTWVSEHVRGPEEAPLVKKTRLVTEQKEGPDGT